MLGDADDVLLVDVKGPLELAGGRGEAVEDEVLAHTVNPLSPEVSFARTFTRDRYLFQQLNILRTLIILVIWLHPAFSAYHILIRLIFYACHV